MPSPFSTGPGYEVSNLIESGAESTQLSPDETKIYISTDSGEILVYDLASLTLLQTISVAAELESMSLSDDGSTAYVIGAETAGGEPVIYEVNLTTGASTILPGTAGLGATDIEFIDGDRLLVSAQQTWVYDLSTQQASTPTGTNPVGFFDPSVMVESDGLVLIGQLVTSDGPLEVYDETLGQVISAGSSFAGGGASGFNAGVMAISREAGLIAQFLPVEGIKIYDLDFNIVANDRFFGFYDGGFAFSSDGSLLLALRGDTLTAFDPFTLQPRQLFDLSGSGITLGNVNGGDVNGDALTITSDDMRIIVTDMSTGFVHVIELAEPLGSNPGLVGTDGDDELSVVLGQDVDGLGGTDRLTIDLREAEAGVTADFRELANNTSITIEGATIANIENIQRIDGSEFDDFFAIYQDFPIGNAQVFGYGGDDEIYVSVSVGTFGPQIFGGDGNDLIDARGTFQDGDYYGDAGDDTIYTSNSFSASASGGDGNDILHSWGDAFGGAGNDTITLYEPGDVTNPNSRGSGGEGDDIINVDLATPFGDAPDYQLEGNGGADTLTGGDGSDYITSVTFDGNGTSAEDTGTERDVLRGGAGIDALFAGFGDDVDGGADFDSLELSLAGSQSAVTLDTDDLLGSSPFVLGGGTIQNIEAISRLYGSNFDDMITVGPASNPPSARTQVLGGLGDDTFMNVDGPAFFNGGDGNDRYTILDGSEFSSFAGGDGIDTIDNSQNSSGLTVALSDNPSSTFGSGPSDRQISDVENVEGGVADDTIIGSVVANVLNGNGGDDVIDGGLGDDILNGGGGVDEVQFLHGFNGVTVDLALTVVQNTGLGLDTLSGFENLTGSDFNDTLTGDALANVIEGRAGNDVIDGGEGDDTLMGGEGIDEVVFLEARGAVSVSLAISAAQNTGMGIDTISGFENLTGSSFNDTLTGNALANVISGLDGDDTIDGGDGIDTAVFAGDFANFDVREDPVGAFTITGAGTDSAVGIEVLRFDDIEVLLDLGQGIAIDPGSDNPDTFMVNIRDYDGNDLGSAASWERIGEADANLDGGADYIFVNRENGRFAEVGVDANGLVQFDNHGQGGDTRVVGIYIDPLVESGEVEQGSDFDSQRRFQNDLFIGNISTVLGSEDYDSDGFADIYFALTDGTAYLRAIMHADGNIQYANYQSEEQVRQFLTENGYDETTFGDWFGSGVTGAEEADDKQANIFADEPVAIEPISITGSSFPHEHDIESLLTMRPGEYIYQALDTVHSEFFG